MDYGKAAYLKVAEIEARLDWAAREARTESTVCRTVRPVAELTGGEAYFVARIRGEGALALFVKAELTHAGADGGEFSVFVNGLKAGMCAYSPAADGSASAFVMCSAYVNGFADVTVAASGPVTLYECSALAYGSGAETGTAGGEAAVDGKNGRWALVEARENDVLCYAFTEENFALGKPVYLGTGVSADVAATDEGYAFAYVDGEGNLFAARTDGELNLISRESVAEGASGCAIAYYRGAALVAGVFDGRARCFAYFGGGLSLPLDVNAGVTVKAVRFVKNVGLPRLIVTADAGSFLLSAEDEKGGSSPFKAGIKLYVGGV